MSGSKVMPKLVRAGSRVRAMAQLQAPLTAVAEADPTLDKRLDEMLQRAQSLFSSAERMIARLG